MHTAPALYWVEKPRGTLELNVLNRIYAIIRIPHTEDINDGIVWWITDESIFGTSELHSAFSIPEAQRAAEKELGIPFEVEVTND